MKNSFYLLLSLCLMFSIQTNILAQTKNTGDATYWKNNAGSALWNADNWYNASQGWDDHNPNYEGYRDLIFDNNNNVSMTNDFTGEGTKLYRIRFITGASVSRTINGSTENTFYYWSGNKPKIENTSENSHTINFPIKLGANPLEINPVNESITIGGSINNDGNYIDVFGTNNKALTITSNLTGTGGITLKQSSILIFTTISKDYSGPTIIEAGRLELEVSIASSAVTVKNGATLKINGDDVTVNSLTVEPGGNVEIVAGKSLTVSGNIVNNQTAGIVLKSPESSGPSGSLIVEGTVSGSGTITAERYIAAASWSSGNDGFHLISSPVAAEEISGEWTPSSDGNDYDFYGWSEEDQTWVNQKNTTEDPTWAAFHPSANFNVGQGYLVAYQTAATKSFSGTLNIGDKEVTLTQSGTPAANNSYGYNLIGNPFTSALDWTHESWGTENSNYSGVAKIWSGGAFIDVVTTNPVDNDVTVIPAMNGFFVYTSTHNNTFTIPAAAQVHSADNWHKSVNNNQAIKLSVKGVSSTLSQGSSVRFNPEATSGFDLAFDSYFMAGYAPMFYSVSEGKNYSTNTLPAYDSETTIPFVFVKNEYTDFELELTNSIEGQHIFLTDNKTGAIHKFSENPVYSFTASEGDSPNRFLLHFGMVGLGEQEQASTLQAYVVDNRLYVNNSLEQAQLAVYDLQGRFVAGQSLNTAGLQALPLELPAGVYIVRLNNASESRAVKINVQ